MRFIHSAILLFLFSLSAFSQNTKATVSIQLQNCFDRLCTRPQNIALQNPKKGTIMQFGNSGNTIEFTDLDTGKYQVFFQVSGYAEDSVPVHITEFKKYEIVLCSDSVRYPTVKFVGMIDQLKDGESYLIVMFSQGCFHHFGDSLRITRNGMEYELNRGKEIKKLSATDIELIRVFEKELHLTEDAYCTTTDIYYLKFRNQTLKFTDGSCNWNGLYHLEEKLHLLKN